MYFSHPKFWLEIEFKKIVLSLRYEFLLVIELLIQALNKISVKWKLYHFTEDKWSKKTDSSFHFSQLTTSIEHFHQLFLFITFEIDSSY